MHAHQAPGIGIGVDYKHVITMIILSMSQIATHMSATGSRIPKFSIHQIAIGRTGSFDVIRHRRFSSLTTTTFNPTLEYKKSTKIWNVYLSGEIHTEWRQEIMTGIQKYNLPIELTYPILDHTDSDDCAAYLLGMPQERPQWDMMGAKMNAIRTQTLIKQCDILIVKFGEQYRQWNAALDVGFATAHDKSILTIHPPSLSHMLKEVNACANAVCSNTDQAIHTLRYIIHGDLTHPPHDGDQYIPIANRLGKGNPNP